MNDTVHEFALKTEKLSSVHTFATNQEFLLKQLTDNFENLEDLNVTKSVA
jgi:L-lysine 2,3-aminomutase